MTPQRFLTWYAALATVAVIFLGYLHFFNHDADNHPVAALGQANTFNISAQRPALRKDTPEEIEIFANFLRLNFSRTHGALMQKLRPQLTQDELEELFALLNERGIRHAAAQKESSSAGSNPSDAINIIDLEINSRIAQSLGHSILEIIQHYNETLPMRQQVDTLNQSLIYAGEPLSGDQIELLVDLLHANATPPLPGSPSLDLIDEYIRRREAAHPNILGTASEHLSPTQLAQLQREMDLEIAFMRYYKIRQHGVLQLRQSKQQ